MKSKPIMQIQTAYSTAMLLEKLIYIFAHFQALFRQCAPY